MAQVALYRAWRPLDFTSIVGQSQVVRPLRQAVINQESAHAYLFCGTRGTGKTSMAKILARAVNCLQPRDGNPCNECEICQGILNGSLLDVQEIDAASNNSVDNVRRIIEEIVFLPVKARYKVYIVDEVHMLSPGAFNALLKTLEEPPAHAIFILATTEAQRLPATILSRCQRYDFRRIPNDEIIARLRQIAESESIEITDEALTHVAVLSDGALRDAISLLDQCKISFPEGTTLPALLNLLGSVDKVFAAALVQALAEGQATRALHQVAELVAQGQDIARFSLELSGFFRDVLVMKQAPECKGLVDGSEREIAEIRRLSEILSVAELIYCIREMSAMVGELKYSVHPRISLEVCLLKILGSLQQSKQARSSKGRTAQAPTEAVQAPPVATQAPTEAPQAPTEATQAPTEAVQAPTEAPQAPTEAPQAPPVATQTPTEAPQAPTEWLDPPINPLATLTEEDLALLPASVIAEAEEKARLQQKAEAIAATAPETYAEARQASAGATQPSAKASPHTLQPDLLLQRWQETLDILKSEDRYLQLFAKDVEVKPAAEGLELHFYKSTESNYNVLSGKEGRRLFQIWKRLWAPLETELILFPPIQENSAAENDTQAPAPNHWLNQLRQAAAELDINFEEEE